MLKWMGVFRVVGFLALVAACDKGAVEPAKGSAQPPPAPLPSPDPAPPPVDAMSIDEQLLNGKTPHLWVRACNDTGKDMTKLEWHDDFEEPQLPAGWCTAYRYSRGAYGYTYAAFHTGMTEYRMQPIDYIGETPLVPGYWAYHIKNLDPTHHTADIRAERDEPPANPWSSIRVCNDTDVAMTFQGQFVGPANVKEHTCSDYVQSSRADSEEPMFFDAAGTSFSDWPLGNTAMVRELPPGKWSYHITKLDPKAGTFTYDPRPDVK